ncbi:MAG: hypothetical protein LC099_02680 [Anaerolineales bacterium]|nr:hypothetical protein [Anaerolineales bacterium]
MSEPKNETKRFLSLRYKLLIPLLSFSVVMFVIGYFGARAYLDTLTLDMMAKDTTTVLTYVNGCLDKDALQEIYDEAKTASPEQLKSMMKDPTYVEQKDCLASVVDFYPGAWIITYYPVNEDAVAVGIDNDMSSETYLLGELRTAENDGDFDLYQSGLQEAYAYDDLEYDENQNPFYGFVSPMTNSSGETIGGIVIYLDAGVPLQSAQFLYNYLLAIFGGVFLFIVFLVWIITQRSLSELNALGAAARRVADGDYAPISVKPQKLNDEVSLLGELFNTMVGKVEKREEKLQKQVDQLKIQIDGEKRKKAVDEIVESDFFKDLQERAAQARKAHDQKPQS